MDNFTVKNFTNIDEEDFEGMYGGKTQIIRRGQTKQFSEKIANHFAGQLIYKILVRKGKDPYIDPEKESLLEEIIGKTESVEESAIIGAAETIPEEEKEEKIEEEFPALKEKKKRGRTRK